MSEKIKDAEQKIRQLENDIREPERMKNKLSGVFACGGDGSVNQEKLGDVLKKHGIELEGEPDPYTMRDEYWKLKAENRKLKSQSVPISDLVIVTGKHLLIFLD